MEKQPDKKMNCIQGVWYVCLETEQHIKNRAAAAGKPRQALMEQGRRKKAPRISSNQGAKVILESYQTSFPSSPSKKLTFPVKQHGQSTLNILCGLSTSRLTSTMSICSWP